MSQNDISPIEQAIIAGDEEKLTELLIAFKADPKNRQWYGGVGPNAIQESDVYSDARFILLRSHFFDSWPAFTAFLKSRSETSTMVSKFEKAADAIANGDENILQTLLQENP